MSDSDSDSTSDEDYVPEGKVDVQCNSYKVYGVESPVVKLVLYIHIHKILSCAY